MTLRQLVATLLFTTIAGSAGAQAPAVALDAQEHYRLGLRAARTGNLEAATRHFERALELEPNQTVRYNLGQTYTTLGRPLDAVRVLRSYLDAAAASDGARIAEVQKLISRNEKRIGTFSIRAEPAEAAVEIDGERVTPSGEGQVSVAVGKHIVLATHDGYEPLLLPIEVRGGETLTLHLSLSTLRPMLVPVPVDTLVSVRILPSDPSARVFVDGSPFDGQVLPAGRHRVEVMGQGYAPWARDVEVSAGRTNVVLVPLEPLPPRESAARADRKAWALVTGVSGILCAGIVTALQIYNNGRYREWSSDRDQLSQEITAGSAGPDRAARARDLQQRAAQIQRTDDVSVLFGGASVALLGTSTVLYFGK